MTLPRSAADVLSGHVVFEIESIDRMYLNVWQPRLQHGAGAAAFFTSHRGHAYASTALMDPMTKAFVADIHHFTGARGPGEGHRVADPAPLPRRRRLVCVAGEDERAGQLLLFLLRRCGLRPVLHQVLHLL